MKLIKTRSEKERYLGSSTDNCEEKRVARSAEGTEGKKRRDITLSGKFKISN